MTTFLTVDIEGISENPNVISVTGSDAISNDYDFKLLVNTSTNTPLDTESCLKQVISLNFNQHDIAYKKIAVINSIQQVFSSNPHDLQYQLTCRSPLEQLKTVTRSNVFIDTNPVDIISEILHKYSHLDFHISCSDSLPTKAFTHQYKETDYDFIGRLCEHWGIHYYFDTEHDNTLIFADDKHYQESETQLRFIENPTPEQSHEAITALNMQQSPTVSHVIVEGRNPEQDSQIITSEYGTPSPEQASLKYNGIGINNEDEGLLIAQRRYELQECQFTIYSGTTTAQNIKPGFITHVKINDQQQNLALLILTTEYSAINQSAMTNDGVKEFSLQFTAIPANITFRPSLERPIPTAISSTARIHSAFDSPSLAHRDSLGRYKVVFDYMETERVSHWIRKSQSAAKDNHLDVPLLPNTEIQIAYLGGNPDLPYISCALENSQSTTIPSNNERPYTTSLHTSGILSLEAGRSLSANYRAPMNKQSATNPATEASAVTQFTPTATISEYNRMDNSGIAYPNDERLSDTNTDYNVEAYQGQVYKVQDTVSFFLGDNPAYYFGQQYREVHIKNPDQKTVPNTQIFDFSDEHFLAEDCELIDPSSAINKDRQVGMVRKLFGNRYNYHDGHIVTVREGNGGTHKTINYGARYIEHLVDKTDTATESMTNGFPNKPDLQPSQNDYVVRNHHKQFKINHNDSVTVQTGNTYIERTGDTERVQKSGSSKVTITGTTREKTINISGGSIKEISASKIEAHFTTPDLYKTITGNRRTHIYGTDDSLITGAKTGLIVGANISTEVGGSAKIVLGADGKLVLGTKQEMIVGPTVKWNSSPESKVGPGNIKKEGFSLSDAEVAINKVKADLNSTKVSITNALLTMIG